MLELVVVELSKGVLLVKIQIPLFSPSFTFNEHPPTFPVYHHIPRMLSIISFFYFSCRVFEVKVEEHGWKNDYERMREEEQFR